ncbi:uncharacterized protein LACBIDRAFT_333321 [Laccaria bicolor S238N-H82]|uniref:Predicted protein n=1 Tax=Laccaria bicolor (strain S238N-H82 / ATCC MYA-4686) TaxID=486041 RepID=B0DVK1_LACBS|nr:uncharacterized protein LACBIDRAFT_333321 [Laccaria bicolor S238N-H82]EDR01431.1 predicted protein [Laccaria bicolor S238N-H82]|eukprot:XP_001887976.1 predicted protein [Laccaria bicolor S238N-H82]
MTTPHYPTTATTTPALNGSDHRQRGGTTTIHERPRQRGRSTGAAINQGPPQPPHQPATNDTPRAHQHHQHDTDATWQRNDVGTRWQKDDDDATWVRGDNAMTTTRQRQRDMGTTATRRGVAAALAFSWFKSQLS